MSYAYKRRKKLIQRGQWDFKEVRRRNVEQGRFLNLRISDDDTRHYLHQQELMSHVQKWRNRLLTGRERELHRKIRILYKPLQLPLRGVMSGALSLDEGLRQFAGIVDKWMRKEKVTFHHVNLFFEKRHQRQLDRNRAQSEKQERIRANHSIPKETVYAR